jgi:transmembrane carrier protein
MYHKLEFKPRLTATEVLSHIIYNQHSFLFLTVPFLNSILERSVVCPLSCAIDLCVMSPVASHGQDMEEQVESPTVKKPARQTLTQIRSFIAGGAGGICAVLVGHPFDLVKVRLQTAERGVYGGAIDVVKKAIAREGLARVCAPFARIGPIVLSGN